MKRSVSWSVSGVLAGILVLGVFAVLAFSGPQGDQGLFQVFLASVVNYPIVHFLIDVLSIVGLLIMSHLKGKTRNEIYYFVVSAIVVIILYQSIATVIFISQIFQYSKYLLF